MRVADQQSRFSRKGFTTLPGLTVACVVLIAAFDAPLCRAATPEAAQEERPFSFERDIGGILTKHGCNTSECHGGVKGKGGFKLSLNALIPAEDYRWIFRGGTFQVLTDEAAGEEISRINLDDPEDSLLLLKPTFEVGHEGGKHFSKSSADYLTILEWIRQGAPFAEQDPHFAIERLEIQPGEIVLDSEGSHQLLVTAHLVNGRREDVTGQAQFRTNNREVAKVNDAGLVKPIAPGEADILVRVPGHVASARVGVIARPLPDFPEVPRHNFIDDHVFAKLKRYHIRPSDLSGDSEFLRRICLDLTGTLPPPGRVRKFLADNDPDKRDKLINVLLDSPEYVDYWVFRFSDLFRVTEDSYWEWVRESIARNKPYDQIARERIEAQGPDGPSRFYTATAKARPVETMVAEDVRVFMGRRMDCSQCHNHPYDVWSQNQFWGIAAFYGRLTITEWVNPIDKQVVYDDPDGHEIDFDGDVVLNFRELIHPRTKEPLIPATFDGAAIDELKRDDPRRALAQWMTSHPYFAEAIVNRMWSYFFGRGIVDPVDDFGSNNPPTHPKLLEALAEDFRSNGHDLKRLVKLIVRSRAYQLSSIPNDSNRNDMISYSHALPRPLDAEVLLDAITRVHDVPFVFEHNSGGEAPPGTRAIQLRIPANWHSRFLEVFERPFRQGVPERTNKPKLAQALHLLAGSTYTEEFSKDGRIARLLDGDASNHELIEELYLAALARFPTDEEQAELQELFAKRSSIVNSSFFEGSTARRAAAEHLLWALISCREFVHNH